MPQHPPHPPTSFDPEDFFAGHHWHQRWELFQGIFLPGRNPVEFICEHVGLPIDLTGKRVLDVGAWNGAFSFECERRGAEVVAFSPEDPKETGFSKLKHLLNSKAHYRQGSVYRLNPDEIGTFDVVLFLGVLYHLRYPTLAVDQISRVATGNVFIETHVLDPWLSANSSYETNSRLLATPLWRFYPGTELGDDASNWFGPNIQAVKDAFLTAGFSISLVSTWGDRAGFVATPRSSPNMSGTYEGLAVIRDSVITT